VQVRVTPVSPSTVTLSWTQVADTTAFMVTRIGTRGQPDTPVATVATNATVVTGLASASTSTFRVTAQLTGCGTSPASDRVRVTTPAGAPARPAVPTDLRVVDEMGGFFDGTVVLGWNQTAGADVPLSYRLYEGAAVFGTSPEPTFKITLPGGPIHTVSVVAVDAPATSRRSASRCASTCRSSARSSRATHSKADCVPLWRRSSGQSTRPGERIEGQ
jgi:hypothetical protein